MRYILKNKEKNKCVCIYYSTQLIIMKMKMEIKNTDHTDATSVDLGRSIHRHKYCKYKKCLSLMILYVFSA